MYLYYPWQFQWKKTHQRCVSCVQTQLILFGFLENISASHTWIWLGYHVNNHLAEVIMTDLNYMLVYNK